MNSEINSDNKKSVGLRLLDFYLEQGPFVDTVVTVLFLAGIFVIDHWVYDLRVDKEHVKSIISDLISNSIALVGFVIAALTVIITFKENTRSIPDRHLRRDQKKAVFVYFFRSKHYSSTVKVFYQGAFVLLMIFVISISLKFMDISSLGGFCNYFLLALTIVMCTTVSRCLLTLYLIIKLQVVDGSEE